jgi:hypothetical protein
LVSVDGLVPPRRRETIAAITPRTAETANTSTRPSWNGPEMRCGKNSRPVSRLRLAGLSDDSAP